MRLPAFLADRIGGIASVDVAAATADEALREVARRYPQLETLVLARDGGVNPMMVVFVNDVQLPHGRLGSQLFAGDVVELIPAIEGGS